MKDLFVKTSNYVAFEAGINKALSRGAMEATNVLVYGPPGTGKTENIDYWAVQNDANVASRQDAGALIDTLKSLQSRSA